jgi:Zn-dependent M28 family amino/carboxypeptidase
MSDFNGFVPGRIALIQRGTCFFGVKVLNAQAAGASGVIIFNEGNPGRTGVLAGSLVDAAGNPIIPTIPVAFTSFDIGQNLLTQYQQAVQNGTPLPLMELSIQAIIKPNAPDYNVIAESKGGDKNHVLVVDAHLDAIYGAGMLDNASGSATILDIAQKMKNVDPLNKLRFIWFGGEELGLLGSTYYVGNLSSNDLSHIGYDLDADVTATPNYIIGVLDPAAPDFFGGTVTNSFPNRVYKASTIARDQAIQYFDSVGLNHELLSPSGTDAINFNAVGIPASGLLTGQDCCKTQAEVDLFGGYRELRRQHPELRRGMCRQPVPLVRQLEQQRSEGAHVHVEGVRHDGGANGLRYESDVREHECRLQQEAADRRRSRTAVLVEIA